MRVAFATTDGQEVNDHFGWAKMFVLYDVSREGVTKAGKVTFSGEGLSENGNDDKLTGKIEALAGCHIICCEAIGGVAAARLTNRRMHPMVVRDESSITAILNTLKGTLNGTPPPWIRKITGAGDPGRFDRFEEDDD
ncbi:MAG: nitrogen fixation protein NifX [Nitrospinae bacterium]|nr:nitrogen fixation protein NifX [Nitrospinota bacterium]